MRIRFKSVLEMAQNVFRNREKSPLAFTKHLIILRYDLSMQSDRMDAC